MPKLKQPENLECIALRGLADWIARTGEVLMPTIEYLSKDDSTKGSGLLSINVDYLRRLVEYNMPWMLYDKFAEEIFRSLTDLLEKTKQSQGFRGSMSRFMSKMNVAVCLVEVLLTKNITKLNMDEVPKMLRQIFYKKFSLLTGLETLNLGSLSGGWKTSDMEPTIISGLRMLRNLRFLTINYDCTDNILEAVCESCPELLSLDMTSSKYITNESIQYFMKFKRLKQLQLYRTGVTLEGFTRIMLNCPTIEDIGRCDDITRVLEYIDLTNSCAGPFNLRRYVSKYSTSIQLQLIVQLCPLLSTMTIFHNSFLSDLTIIIGLSELVELKLLSCDFYGDQIKQVLEIKGCNLHNLHLEHVDQIDVNAVMYISQFCKILKSLTLYNCFLIQHTSLYTRKVNWMPFYSLTKLVYVCEGPEDQLVFILSNAMNIRNVHLGSMVRVSDALFVKVLTKNPLIFLEELRILKSDSLTMATVNVLLNTCCQLRKLTELECWSNLTAADIEHIRNHIRLNNLDLDITSISRYQM